MEDIPRERIQFLNDKEVKPGEYVLYWMQASQRADFNHALEFAIEQANATKKPLLVCFGLTAKYYDANLRHYTFMLEGLKETKDLLKDRGIKMVVRIGDPAKVAIDLGRQACVIVCDCGYIRHQRAWRQYVAKHAHCRVIQVESDAVVPVEVVSEKAEYGAYTIRRKIQKNLERFLIPVEARPVEKSSLNMHIEGMDLNDMNEILRLLKVDRSVPAVSKIYKGGMFEAKELFHEFCEQGLLFYQRDSNQPQQDSISHMSMYLHFGQISPVYMALKVMDAKNVDRENKTSFLEELIVRRELAINFVYFTPDYDSFSCLPHWAKETLNAHKKDRREYVYSQKDLEAAKTHDEYWNAAMKEMKYTGFMHNYMRMYWGKKILEWSKKPEEAFETALAINNKYFIDGRDPNSYAGIAWSFGMHDRPWMERSVFGKVRYMAASGLERKCDINAYVEKIKRYELIAKVVIPVKTGIQSDV